MQRIMPTVLALALVLVGSPGIAEPEESGPSTLIVVIGAHPNDNEEGASEPEETTDPARKPGQATDDGTIGQSVRQREEQLKSMGQSVQKAYFSTLQDYLCWLEKVAVPGGSKWNNIEMYGHGSNSGPEGNPDIHPDPDPDPSNQNDPTQIGQAGFPTSSFLNEKAKWELLGRLMRAVMTGKGHIVFGWCHSGGGVQESGGVSNPRSFKPAGVVAGKTGRPVYTPIGCIDFTDPPANIGDPFTQPHPPENDGQPATSGDNPEPVQTGWDKQPPVVDPPGAPPPQPNIGETEPEPVPVEERGDAGLPKSPGEDPEEGEPVSPLQPEERGDPHEGPGTSAPAEPGELPNPEPPVDMPNPEVEVIDDTGCEEWTTKNNEGEGPNQYPPPAEGGEGD